MKKTFYTLITLLTFGLISQSLNAQCTDIDANGGNPWTNFEALPQPCDDGTGCTIVEITGFEVFASEAYNFPNLVGGVDYTFGICNGAGAGNWVPDFTVLDPAGDVVAFGAGNGDACSITWTAATDGEYVVIINEAEQCGGGPNLGTDNGFPSITCINGPSCAPTVTACNAGTLETAGEIAICDIAETFDLTAINDTFPTGGSYAMIVTDNLGGTGGQAGGIALLLPANSITLDAGFNGFLAAQNLEPLSGAWVFRGATADAGGAICDITVDSLIVNFGTESPAIVDIVSNGVDELTVNATGGVEPYSYLWSDGQTTQTAAGLVPDVYTVLVVDANGCLVEGESSFTVSTNNIASLNEHSIMPNPNTGFFSVQLSFDQSEFVEVEVMDLTGKLIQTANREMTSGQFDFNLNSSAAGVYFVRITAGSESLTQRVIVSK